MDEFPEKTAQAQTSAPDSAAATVRLLGRLVTVLTAVTILGLIVIVALLAVRLNRAPPLPLPETISLPAGTVAQAVTVARDWYLVVTQDDRLLVFDRDDGRLLQTVPLGGGR